MPIVRRTRAEIDLSKFDWTKVDQTTDEEIDAMIAEDPDTAPEWTDEELARARRVLPDLTGDDVRTIRQRLGLSQEQFAGRFGFSVDTVRNYEQGHRRPRGPARVLLQIIATEPDAVTRALLRARQRS
jgi:putative transcriptional regulator